MRSLGALLVVSGLGAGCLDEPPASDVEPIKIGVLSPLTGGLAGVGESLVDAALLVEQEVAAVGGLLGGRPVQFVIADTQTDEGKAREAAVRLVQDEGVVAVVGAAASSSSLAAQEVTGPAQVPQVSCCSTSSQLRDAQGQGQQRYLFRTVPSDLLQVAVVGRVAAQQRCTRLAVMHLNDAYGQPFGDAIADQAPLIVPGLQTVAQVPFPDEKPSYVDEVRQVRDAGPDCIALVAFQASGGAILRDWFALADTPDVTWIGTDGVRDDKFVEAAGSPAAVDGVLGTAPITAPAAATYNSFSGNYRATFGKRPEIFNGNQYDAAMLLVLAIEHAGSTQGGAIRDGLFQVSTDNNDGGRFYGPGQIGEALAALRDGQPIDYLGASGPVDLDAYGEVLADYEVWRYDAASDSFVTQDIVAAADLKP